MTTTWPCHHSLSSSQYTASSLSSYLKFRYIFFFKLSWELQSWKNWKFCWWWAQICLRKENLNQLPQQWTAVYNLPGFALLVVLMLMGMQNLEYWSLIYHQPQWFSLLFFWNKKNQQQHRSSKVAEITSFLLLYGATWTSF